MSKTDLTDAQYDLADQIEPAMAIRPVGKRPDSDEPIFSKMLPRKGSK